MVQWIVLTLLYRVILALAFPMTGWSSSCGGTAGSQGYNPCQEVDLSLYGTRPVYITIWWADTREPHASCLGAVVGYAHAVGGMVFALPIIVEAPDPPPDMLTYDAIFVGGATLFGLVVFGSLLTVAFNNGARPVYGKASIVMLFGGAALAAGVSFGLMLISALEFWPLLSFVFVGMFLVLLGAARVTDEWFKRREQDNTTDSPPPMGSPIKWHSV